MADNATITLLLPCEHIRIIDSVSKDNDLSRAQFIRKLVKENINANSYDKKYPAPVVKIEPTINAIATAAPRRDTQSKCKSCGVEVVVSPVIHEANGRLCKSCKVKIYDTET